jgi:hypothetical protein
MSKRKKRKGHKLGGAVARAGGDADLGSALRAFQEAEHTRRCKAGSMCREYARQLLFGTQLQAKIQSSLNTKSVGDEGASGTGDCKGPTHSADGPFRGFGTFVPSMRAALAKQVQQQQSGGTDGSNVGGGGGNGSTDNDGDSGGSGGGDDSGNSRGNSGGDGDGNGSADSCGNDGGSDGDAWQQAQQSQQQVQQQQRQVQQQRQTQADEPASAMDEGSGDGAERDFAVECDEERQSTELPSTVQCTRLPLTPAQVEECLYSIQLARQRKVKPVLPLRKGQYSVLRSDYGECSYSCPGGYSLVKVEFCLDASGCGVLHTHCNCSEFRSCRSGMGSHSRAGANRTCTCSLMVVLANALAAPIDNLQNGCSAWLLASHMAGKVTQSHYSALITNGSQARQHAELIDKQLASKGFPEQWPSHILLELKAATTMIETTFQHSGALGTVQRDLETIFPSILSPLPVEKPQCPMCIDADGCPRQLQSRSRHNAEAWVFVGQVVLRQPVQSYICQAVGHHGPSSIEGYGVEWTSATYLFNVCNAWFFSVLLLDAVTKNVKQLRAAPDTACQRILSDTWELMAAVEGDKAVLPNQATAVNKMYDAWYAYEIVLKKVNYARWSICRLCGLFPPKTGSDACAKVALNLGEISRAEQLDYAQQEPGTPLWTQEELLNHCYRHLLSATVSGASHKQAPIPVDLAPPLFQSEVFAGVPVNTEAQKRAASSSALLAEGLRPTTEACLWLALLVGDGTIDIVNLRNGGYGQTMWLDDMLGRCKCPPAVQSKLKSNADKRAWLLLAYDTIGAGDSDCHMFVRVMYGTGGTCTVSCPHGVVMVYKFLFNGESNRDHADLLRSLVIEPAVHWMDDSCGLVTHRQGTAPDEFRKLYGENRGCPKPWVAHPADDYMRPVDIPELNDNYIHRVSAATPTIRKYARQITNAKGKMRTERHPFLYKHRWRLVLTDRMHQSLKKKTHKRKTCHQHLASIVSTLNHDRTNIMESLNARMKSRLKTICTANPYHAIPFYHRLVYWENQAITNEQDRALQCVLPPGREIGIDKVFGWAVEVCSSCKGQIIHNEEHSCEQQQQQGEQLDDELWPPGRQWGHANIMSPDPAMCVPGQQGMVGVHSGAMAQREEMVDPDDEQEEVMPVGQPAALDGANEGTDGVLPVLEVGSQVLYTTSEGRQVPAQVKAVHYDAVPAYYTIEVDGHERYTECARLSTVEVSDSARGASGANHLEVLASAAMVAPLATAASGGSCGGGSGAAKQTSGSNDDDDVLFIDLVKEVNEANHLEVLASTAMVAPLATAASGGSCGGGSGAAKETNGSSNDDDEFDEFNFDKHRTRSVKEPRMCSTYGVPGKTKQCRERILLPDEYPRSKPALEPGETVAHLELHTIACFMHDTDAIACS